MNLANRITMVRIALTPFFLICLAYDQYLPAFWFFLASSLTDGLDGFIARKYRQKTKLGTLLDPLADKIALIPTYLLLVHRGLIPKWLFILLLCRDFAILVGWLTYLVKGQDAKAHSRPTGKWAIGMQMVYFLLLIFNQAYPESGIPPGPWLEILGYIVALLTFTSFLDYLKAETKKVAELDKKS